MHKKVNTLVLLDFDGTITKKDSFRTFLKFTHHGTAYYHNVLKCLPSILLFFIRLIDEKKLKEKILSCFYEGMSKEELYANGNLFIDHLLKDGAIKYSFIKLIEEYQKNGAIIAIVSASPDIWIHPFCKKFNLEAICTQLEFTPNGFFTGNIWGKNCKGEEKKALVLKKYSLKEYDEIIIYGDSDGDKAMMTLATQEHWIAK